MNIATIMIVSLLSAVGTPAAAEEVLPGPFPDVTAIKAWASSSWGGSVVDEFSSGKRSVVVVRDQYTSGVESCRLTVFVRDAKKWKVGLKLRDVRGYGLDLKHDGDEVIIKHSKSGAEIAKFSISALAIQDSEFTSN
jgi:hypothetical protein